MRIQFKLEEQIRKKKEKTNLDMAARVRNQCERMGRKRSLLLLGMVDLLTRLK